MTRSGPLQYLSKCIIENGWKVEEN